MTQEDVRQQLLYYPTCMFIIVGVWLGDGIASNFQAPITCQPHIPSLETSLLVPENSSSGPDTSSSGLDLSYLGSEVSSLHSGAPSLDSETSFLGAETYSALILDSCLSPPWHRPQAW